MVVVLDLGVEVFIVVVVMMVVVMVVVVMVGSSPGLCLGGHGIVIVIVTVWCS